MKQFLDSKNNKILAGLAGLLLVGAAAMSFQDTPFMSNLLKEEGAGEEVAAVKFKSANLTMAAFNALQESLNDPMLNIGQEMEPINYDQNGVPISSAVYSIDMGKLMATVALSLKVVDMSKIVGEITASMNDPGGMEDEAALKLEMENTRKEIAAAREEMHHSGMGSMQNEIEAARIDLANATAELKRINSSRIMTSLQVGLNSAKIQLQAIKRMFDEMENDGLINGKDGFDIEYKNNELYINGARQKEDVTGKYRNYFDGDHFRISIDKE